MKSSSRRKRAIALLAAMASFAFVQGASADGVHVPGEARDTEIEAILRLETHDVIQASGLDPDYVRITVVADKTLNAFATQGQAIFVHAGLIEETKTPNQLVGVLAHEAGHLSGGHTVRSDEMNRAGMVPFLLTLGLGVVAAFAGAPQAAVPLIGSSQWFGYIGAMHYSREQESRADQAAVTSLEKAGLSGRGLVEFFDEFRYQEVFSDQKRYPFFRSHPLSSDRIEALRRRVEEQPHVNVVDTPQMIALHELMKAKLIGFLEPQAVPTKYPESNQSYPARYARAIAAYQLKDIDHALKSVDALLAEQPNNPYLWELKGQILFENGRAEEAAPCHKRSVELKGDAPLLRVNYAQALAGEDKPELLNEAIAQLKVALTMENDNYLAWQVLSESYDRKNMPGEARLAAAEANFHLGDLNQARVFAMRAREYLKRDTPEWRKANDIILVANPSQDDLKALARNDG